MNRRQSNYKSSRRGKAPKRGSPQWLGIAIWSIIALGVSGMIYAGIAVIAFMPQWTTAMKPSATSSPISAPTGTPLVAADAPATATATGPAASLPPPTGIPTLPATAIPTPTPSFTATLPTPSATATSSATLPTVTDTPIAFTPTEGPTSTPTFTQTETATATATVTPEGGGWTFAGIRLTTDPDESDPNIVIYGEVVNNSGAVQEIGAITGLFYDAQGQVIANEVNTTDYWPVEAIPVGGRMPFEMVVIGIQSAASYKLSVESSLSPELPRQNFEFSAVTQTNESGNYCVGGKVRNPGEALKSTLIIVVTLYDGQNKVINFGSDEKVGVTTLVGDKTVNFRICITPPNQDTVRYDLQAFGY
jgi:hypothetical protein